MTQESGLFTKPLKTNYQYLYFNLSRPAGRLFCATWNTSYVGWAKGKGADVQGGYAAVYTGDV